MHDCPSSRDGSLDPANCSNFGSHGIEVLLLRHLGVAEILVIRRPDPD